MNDTYDFSDYPRSCIIHGVKLDLVSENPWVRRFASKDGKQFHLADRVLDGSFDYSILDRIEIESLTERERFDAGFALSSADFERLPSKWQKLVEEHREQNIK